MSSASAAPKVGLPFKRTAKRRLVDTSTQKEKAHEQNALDLFANDRKKALEKQERLASEKAAEQAAKKERLRRERLAGQKLKGTDSRESSEVRSSSSIETRESAGLGPKRKRGTSLLDSSDEAIGSPATPTRKSSRSGIKTTSRSRDSASSKPTPSRSRLSRSAAGIPSNAQIIPLDDSDDGDYVPPARNTGKGKKKAQALSAPQVIDDDSDDNKDDNNDLVTDELTQKWVHDALERMRQRKENDAIPAEILIESRLDGIPNLKVKFPITKQLSLARKTWEAKTKRTLELEHSRIEPALIDTMFFTWKGNKIYDWTTLVSLGIKPVDKEGHLYATLEDPRDGFVDWDKVHIEAWTPELFEQHQISLEKEAKRQRGELNDEEEEEDDIQPQPEPKDNKIKVILKSKDYGEQPLKVPPTCDIALLLKAFRKTKKEALPANAQLEARFDGEVLDADSKLDEAGVENMDVVEIHVR